MKLSKHSFYLIIGLTILLSGCLPEGIISVSSIYNRPDQAKIRFYDNSENYTLLVDQSGIDIGETLNKENIIGFLEDGTITALQPRNLKREERENEIRFVPKKPLPDEVQVVPATFYKTEVELGEENGKKLITEVFLKTSENERLDTAMILNFSWSSLGVDKECKKKVCKEWVIKEGKPVCKIIKCNN